MPKILSVSENKQFLTYHKKSIPKTIHGIKKKAIKLMIKTMCKTNCDINNNYKHFLSILHRKKMISPNNKNMHNNTSKMYIRNKKCFIINHTRNVLLNYYF